MISVRDMANALRFLSADAVQKANSGHPGMPMGMADAVTVLYRNYMKFDPKNPDWFDRDRFVLSAGHGSALLYSLLHLTGYDVSMDDLKNFRQLGSKTAGHPEYGHAPGIETTTGPLGQGIATAVGMALAEKNLRERFGRGAVDHYTYVVAGDGCLMEGISHEAVELAGHLKLSRLIVLWDDNGITIDGKTDVALSSDNLLRFQACGWDVCQVDGHNHEEVAKALDLARKSDKPTLVSCKTIIGFGAPNMQGTSKVHGSPLGDEELAAARKNLGWEYESFEVPEEVLNEWRAVGNRGKDVHKNWRECVNEIPNEFKSQFDLAESGKLPEDWKKAINIFKEECLDDEPKVATRKASQMALEALVPSVPQLMGGSADLTGSNLTKVFGMKEVTPASAVGNYIHYGVREHAMAAIMNGLALHGGFIPFGGTFFVFTDYLRPALRLSALMEQRVIYVMTHDSIGLGEDGPTHQPIEHLASLRAMPNVLVFRPCDVIETAECWELAIENEKTPSVLALSRQGLPLVRNSISENLCAKGAYVLKEADGERQATILATGSEVEIALKAREELKEKGVNAAVISMPCQELFDKQSAEYKKQVLGEGSFKVAVEAASPFGWERYVGLDGAIIAIDSFGASAPAKELYKHFGITSEAVVDAVLKGVEN